MMLKYNELLDLMKNNQEYIEKFELTKNVGTKKLQQKFHVNAIQERNEFVNTKIRKFNDIKSNIYKLLEERVNNLKPEDNTIKFDDEEKLIDDYKQLIIYTGDMFSNNYKLGFEVLISKIDDINTISLKNINDLLTQYIEKFKFMNIRLSINDFSYSMFVNQYMTDFFNNFNNDNFDQIMQKSFEKIYFECPNLITHLKLNMYDLLNKYKKQIAFFTKKYIDEVLEKDDLKNKDIIQIYRDKKYEFESNKEKNEFINLDNFLNRKYSISDYLRGSQLRDKNYNLFSNNDNYDELSNEEKANFSKEIVNLYHTLLELKEYYYFEIIIKDIVSKYKKKTDTKDLYNQKLKELVTEEKIRAKICKDYNKAQGIGFLAKKNNEKSKLLKLKMNEEVTKLSIIYKELNDLEINNKINDSLNDSSSIYALGVCSFSSYYYLQNIMTKNYNDEDFDLDNLIDRFFKFIYSPYNTFLKKSNGLVDYDIDNIIADKYHLLGLKINEEMISIDNIDSTIDNIKFITIICGINKGNLTIEEMNFIFNFKNIKNVNEGIL